MPRETFLNDYGSYQVHLKRVHPDQCIYYCNYEEQELELEIAILTLNIGDIEEDVLIDATINELDQLYSIDFAEVIHYKFKFVYDVEHNIDDEYYDSDTIGDHCTERVTYEEEYKRLQITIKKNGCFTSTSSSKI